MKLSLYFIFNLFRNTFSIQLKPNDNKYPNNKSQIKKKFSKTRILFFGSIAFWEIPLAFGNPYFLILHLLYTNCNIDLQLIWLVNTFLEQSNSKYLWNADENRKKKEKYSIQISEFFFNLISAFASWT